MWHHEEARDGRLPRALPSALPTWRCCLPPCWLVCFNCSAIVLPHYGRRSQRSGRWYVPTNEEKTPCVNFNSSLSKLPTSIFSVRGAMQSDSPTRGKIDEFAHIFISKHRPTDLFGESVWNKDGAENPRTDSPLRTRHLLSTLTGSGRTCGAYGC